MTPEEFKEKCEELYQKRKGSAGEEGHIEVDCLMEECLRSLGYGEGIDIIWSMTNFWYG